jgi:hypothetical protein
MLPRISCRIAWVLVVGALTVTCSHSSPTTATPPPAAHATITIDGMTIVGDRAAGAEYEYRVVLHLRETAGVTATIRAVELTFMRDADLLMTARSMTRMVRRKDVKRVPGAVRTDD